MNSVANPVCFLAPLMKNIQKISLSGGGGVDSVDRLAQMGGTDRLVSGQGPSNGTENGTVDRLANLGLPWGLMHVHIPATPKIDIEEFIEHYDDIDPSVYDTLFGMVKKTK